MSVYHFTIHAYRTWDPDHKRGYTKKGDGYQPSDPDIADQYDRHAKQERVLFNDDVQREIVVFAHDVCSTDGWKLEAAGFDPTHTHVIISWKNFVKWEWVDQRLKNLLALKLNRRHNTPGKRWFTRRHGAPRQVENRKHFDYLLTTYLPDHPGFFWKNGMELPQLPVLPDQ
jgi:hypothetical protein